MKCVAPDGATAPAGRNSFPRGEAVERSETEEECGRKRESYPIFSYLFLRFKVSPFLFRPGLRRATFPSGEGTRPAAANTIDNHLPHQSRKNPERRTAPDLSLLHQHSFAPAGMASSTMIRFSFSSPFSVWMADSSIPQLSRPIIFLGGRFTMATRVLPTSSSGL